MYRQRTRNDTIGSSQGTCIVITSGNLLLPCTFVQIVVATTNLIIVSDSQSPLATFDILHIKYDGCVQATTKLTLLGPIMVRTFVLHSISIQNTATSVPVAGRPVILQDVVPSIDGLLSCDLLRRFHPKMN
jgi:hypothetical protein